MNTLSKADLKGMSTPETEEWIRSLGMEPYRARQIRQWIFNRLACSFDGMTNLSTSLREMLKEEALLNRLETVRTQLSEDGTKKFLFRLHDNEHIESVLIPERDHYTICISSQAGCAMGCRFCLTGRQGFKRNLLSSEIIDQVITVKRSMDNPERLTNIVFMGMGEPLANYHNVLAAIQNIIAEDAMNFSHRKVTLSTCGLVPQIRKLGNDTTVNLAVSLNAGDDETRNFLMPINRQHNLKSLISACRDFPLPNRRMITFEYILIDNINDRPEDAIKLVDLLSGIRSKINLIPFNASPDLDMASPSMEKIMEFQDILIKNHFTAIIRKSKGRDISAACGQLKGNHIP
ncbi:MAG: 23S rRNA (adenine(2503)-C(2))-methyltransferase RlmN [Deltaproteobacteria bacterium]|nr:23S rRNA (adenine(2503)-C(2))-methyltransferase RlmN [Deltaproteobacteria bacterium]